ncbi:hypothetical protein SNE40_016146 [Patella caerulea]|uniref:Transmembrane protein n=1 Tax=Patella caerulea TaxID=87958 RepID=A0AAN8J9D4_PATCE
MTSAREINRSKRWTSGTPMRRYQNGFIFGSMALCFSSGCLFAFVFRNRMQEFLQRIKQSMRERELEADRRLKEEYEERVKRSDPRLNLKKKF